MSLYPINLNLSQKSCAVLGGGSVAWRKVNALLKADAVITVISPTLIEPLTKLAKAKKLLHKEQLYRQGDLMNFFLVICATDDQKINRCAAKEASENGALVNVVDASFPSDFTVPAQISRGDLLMTVSTGGKSPAFSRALSKELAQTYGEAYGVYLELLANAREEMKTRLKTSKDREFFWQKVMNQEVLDLIKQGKLNKAEAEIKNAIGSIRSES